MHLQLKNALHFLVQGVFYFHAGYGGVLRDSTLRD